MTPLDGAIWLLEMFVCLVALVVGIYLATLLLAGIIRAVWFCVKAISDYLRKWATDPYAHLTH